ncbi:phasin family protein [Arenimonas caeni]|jgi:poly(hydroxyalkanoate) granule-associated protein|uniref:Poly(Hydroxyalcanoate) granule associated protein n=1 Tax=Arenimonas caeni TaxID=2058085 RepID=A0A2P6MAV2_9GAMM|nr:phasin family protein [Arenimonas caeni]MDY0021675.1 phasin family protein [Arenimonas caeni]PRH83123.1 poly(hydroxyalcanoate) granule associated protein [Arenimonas caeni]
MAKLKKNARSKATSKRASAKPAGAAADLQARAEQVSRSIVGSAQQIWMAGMGAFNRAQGEGSKLFEALVKEGMNIEQSTRKLATRRVDAVRDAVEDRVGVARERAVDTWDRLEKVFEDRVQRALNRLGVPGREDLAELSKRVNELNAELRKLSGGRAAPKKAKAKPAAKKAAAKKPAAKKTARKASAKPTQAAKAPRKRSLPKAPKPVAPSQAG